MSEKSDSTPGVKIRAKSTIKIQTRSANMDWTYPAGLDLNAVVKDITTLLIATRGAEQTREYLCGLVDDLAPESR